MSFSSCAIASSGAARSGIPSEERKEDLHVMLMKLLHHTAHARNPTGKVAQQIELISIVSTEVRVDVPDEHSVDWADPALGVGQEALDGVFPFLRIVEAAVPDQQLNLGKDALRPC